MPRVGKKHFSYDDAGYAAAQAEADRTGSSMITGYARGGSVEELISEGSGKVSDAERRRLAKDYENNSRAANRDFEYDRASYELDQNAGRTISDSDMKRMSGEKGRTMSNRDRQVGRTMSDRDRQVGMAKAKKMLSESGRTMSDNDRMVKAFSDGGEVFAESKKVKVPKGNGAGTMRGMGAATRGGKFSGTF
tara:strand:+ start:188 stop:763 length:576 start_codon:yes stop_codon:yes gene_type:complete